MSIRFKEAYASRKMIDPKGIPMAHACIEETG
jgi:hypothetical protein